MAKAASAPRPAPVTARSREQQEGGATLVVHPHQWAVRRSRDASHQCQSKYCQRLLSVSLTNPMSLAALGSSRKTTLDVPTHSELSGGAAPVWCHEFGAHPGRGWEVWVSRELGNSDIVSLLLFSFFLSPLHCIALHLIVGPSWKYFRPPTCFKFYPIALPTLSYNTTGARGC